MSKNEKVLVKDFLEGYRNKPTEKIKEEYVKSIMKRTYCPIGEKKIILQLMFDSSVVTQGNGVKYVDMFTNRLNVYSAIISLYTNLSFEKDENGKPNAMKAYDQLKSSGALDTIQKIIGETELAELMTVNGNILDTFYSQNDMQNFIANQVTRLGGLIGTFAGTGMKQLASCFEEDEKMEKLAAFLEGFVSNK